MSEQETQDFNIVEAGAANETETSNEQVSEPKVHPAWNKMLDELPAVLHDKVTPYLQEQDRNFQQQLEKYTPFKDYIENGITPDVINSGLNLVQAIESSPVEVYESLQDYLRGQGMLKAEAQAVAREMMEGQSGEDFEDLFDEDEVPNALKQELAELRERQEQQDNYIYEQELAKETDYELDRITTEMDGLKGSYQISEAHEIAIYDLMQNALNAGREMTVSEAAGQLSQMVGGFVPLNGQQPRSNAPTIMGSEGGAGVQTQRLEVPKSDKEKRAMLAQMFEEYQRANNS
jgi:hypothetical protein